MNTQLEGAYEQKKSPKFMIYEGGKKVKIKTKK